jgi:hypothetical protein
MVSRRAYLQIEKEFRVNDYFRSDTRLQLDRMESSRAHHAHAAASSSAHDEMTPIVYVTPLHERGG